jgi:hypothetical protein
MIRAGSLTVLAGLLLAAATPAQTPGGFQWKPGQVLTYRAEQATAVTEVISEGRAESRTKLTLTKRWQVLGVGADGVATLQMSLTHLRHEFTKTNGETLVYDSARPDEGDAQMREQLSRYVGSPLHVLAVNDRGQVVSVKECKFGAASRFETQPPFEIVLPDGGLTAGQGWERAYAITLEPPQGTGEKYPAVQSYVCKGLQNGAATVAVSTRLKSTPEGLLDRVPLFEFQPEGEVVYDTQTGRVLRVQMKIDKELTGHQGEGSSYQFTSSYTEQLVDNP